MKIHYYEFDTALIKNQDKLKTYLDLVQRAQTVLPGCWLAGGAIRDLIFNVPDKGLDFFADQTRLARNLSYTIDVLVPEVLEANYIPPNGNDFQFGDVPSSSAVFKFKTKDHEQLDFIIKDENPAVSVNNFDFSFNQAICDGKSILVSGAFKTTYETGKAELLNVMGVGKTKTRLDMFRSKFPNMDFSQPRSLLYPSEYGHNKPTVKGKLLSKNE